MVHQGVKHSARTPMVPCVDVFPLPSCYCSSAFAPFRNLWISIGYAVNPPTTPKPPQVCVLHAVHRQCHHTRCHPGLPRAGAQQRLFAALRTGRADAAHLWEALQRDPWAAWVEWGLNGGEGLEELLGKEGGQRHDDILWQNRKA